MMQQPTTRGLLVLVTLLTVLVVSVLPTSLYTVISGRAHRQSVQESTRLMAARLAETLRYPLWFVSLEQCELIMTIEMQDPDVTSIVLLDEFDAILLAFERGSAGIEAMTDFLPDRLAAKSYATAARPIFMNNLLIGRVFIYNGMNASLARHRAATILAAGMAIFSSVSLGLVLFIFTERLVTRKIQAMTAVLRSFEGRDYQIRASEDGPREIGQLARSFNSMAATIQHYNQDLERLIQDRTSQLIEAEKLAFLGSLVAGIAHEINTPLGIGITAVSQATMLTTAIEEAFLRQELTEALLRENVAESLEAMQIVEKNLLRASEFIRSFKTLATDQSVEEPRPIRLRAYLNDIVLSLKPSLKRTKHEVVIDCPQDLRLRLIPGLLYQVLSNLVINSITHAFDADETGTMLVSASLSSSTTRQHLLSIDYSDNGRGIAANLAEKIFEPFFTTKKNQGGTGLGLYIVKSIVIKNHGSIHYTPNHPRGSRFILRIPCEIDSNGSLT